MSKLIETAVRQKTAIMVGVITQNQDEEMAKEYLEELKFLIDTWGAFALKSFVQKMSKPDSKHFVGSGKLQEIKSFVKDFAIDMVVFYRSATTFTTPLSTRFVHSEGKTPSAIVKTAAIPSVMVSGRLTCCGSMRVAARGSWHPGA